MKMVSDFCERKFCPKGIRKVFSFSLNPTAWIKKSKESENLFATENIFILLYKKIMINGKYQDIILGEEYLKESLIFLDGYDELYLRLQESSKSTIAFLEDLKNLAKSWNLKIVITSRKTCIDLSDLYKYKFRICQLAKLTRKKQKEWINDVYNTKLFPENTYDIERLYDSFQEDNVHSKVFELLEIPILLQLIVSKYFYDDAQNISELYDKLFEDILNTRKELIIASYNENKTEEFKQIFELYAYDIYKNNDNYAIIESEELQREENTKWKSLLLFYVTSEEEQEKYYTEFIHRSFYQYFQAWYFYNLVLEIVKENQENIKREKIASLFEAICWRKIETDVIDMIGQISQNQRNIQKQEQIQCILDIFEKTDGIMKRKNGEWCLPIRQSNILDRMENLLYNLLMILNIVLLNGLTLSKSKRIETLIKKFDITGIYLPKVVLSNLHLARVNLTGAYLSEATLKKTYLREAHLERANLAKANLEGVYFQLTDLEWTDLESTNLTNAYLQIANLERVNLTGANLTRTHLEGAQLRKATFDPSILKDAILWNTKISRERYDEIAALGIDVSEIIWCD